MLEIRISVNFKQGNMNQGKKMPYSCAQLTLPSGAGPPAVVFFFWDRQVDGCFLLARDSIPVEPVWA